jgi:hypothetical protein
VASPALDDDLGIAQQGADALLVADDPFFSTRRGQLVAQANSRALPAIYYTREFATDGGLVSYGSGAIANYGRAGAYVARILKGTPSASAGAYQLSSMKPVSRWGTRGDGGGICACSGLAGTICRRDTLLIVPSADRLITL